MGDNPPETITKDLTINRLITAMEISKTPEVTPMAPEPEAMWYLSTASLEAPLDRDWTDIYMALTRRWLQKQGKDIPEFLLEPELNEMQRSDLKRLREWIFKKSYEEVKRKCKEMNNKSTLKNQKTEIPSLKRTTVQTDLLARFG
jgi:hypothetical protein